MTDFERLWNADRERLWRYCLKLSRNTNDASDLLQDTAVRGIIAFHQFRREALFITWISWIARNIATDRYRRESLVKMLPLKSAELVEGFDPNPFDTVSNKEILFEIERRSDPEELRIWRLRAESHNWREITGKGHVNSSKSIYRRFQNRVRDMSCLDPIRERELRKELHHEKERN